MDKKKIVWGGISLLIAVLTIYTIVGQSKYFSVQLLMQVLRECSIPWMIAAVVCMFGFIWFEGLALVRISHYLGYGNTTNRGTLYGAADIFFSAITPSATGGQPASALFMIRDKMPASVATASLIINLVMYTLALLTIGLLAVVFGNNLFMGFSSLARIIIIIGFFLLVFLALMFYLLLKKGKILSNILNAIVNLLEKIHIVKNGDKKRMKIHMLTVEYQDCADVIFGKTKMLVEIFVINILQRLSQLGVSFMVFMAIGRGVKEAFDISIIQCFVAIGSNCIPIPGAMGIADYLMIDGFSSIVGQAASGSLEMICRGITFYTCVILSGVIVLYNVLRKKGK